MTRLIYFGPPGTGKTTTLLRRLEEHLKAGVAPDRIAFLTFTRRARREALERVEQTLGIKAKELPYFRTIHSLAFRGLGLKEGDVMGKKQLDLFGEGMGLHFGQVAASEMAAEGIASQEEGDQLLALDNIARLRGAPLRAVWHSAGSGLEWEKVDQFARSYALYKKDTGLLDFTDVLIEFARSGERLPVEVAFIDEAQDLSALQWLVALQAIEGAQQQYVAGDDDQAIYRWAGAEVQVFMELPGERQVLSHSYRLPQAVHALALRIAARIKGRVAKAYTAREDGGKVQHHASAESIRIEAGSSWLWLVRNRYLLGPLQEQLEQRGIVYAQHGASSIREAEKNAIYNWERLRAGRSVSVAAVRDIYKLLRSKTQVAHGHKAIPDVTTEALLSMGQLRAAHGLLIDGAWFDVFASIPYGRRAYYRKLLREHKTLKLEPQVQLETIHGAKGAEAPNVALFLERSRRVWEEAQRSPDDEHRVWYVGCTRARESLHLVSSSNSWEYKLPAQQALEKRSVSTEGPV
jgi:DNA helicase-2/ATP-dependent DNA helicase PcrA